MASGTFFDRYRNPDAKTFNGIAMMADLSGLSADEVAWTANRLKQLMHVEGRTKEEALAIVKREGRDKPWEAPPG